MKLLKSYLIAYLTLLIFVQINTFELDLGLESFKSVSKFESSKSSVPGLIVLDSKPPLEAHLMAKLNAFIFPLDDANKITESFDLFDLEGENLIVYRSDGKTKVQMDVEYLAWFCGKKKFCDYTTFLSKVTEKDLNVGEMKTQVKTFLTKSNVEVNQCFAELFYTDNGNKAIIFCFTTNEDQDKFLSTLGLINDLDFKDPTLLPFDLRTKQTFTLNITDGNEAYTQKDMTFKNDGAYVGKTLVYRYDQIEIQDYKKCKIEQRVPVIPDKFLSARIYNPRCVIRLKYNQFDTYFGTNDRNCRNIIKYIRLKTVQNCRAVKMGPSSMFVNDLKTQPEKGKWKGWVYYYQIGSGPVKNAFHLMDIDKMNVTLTPKLKGKPISINYNNLIWACDNDGACSFKEFYEYLTWTQQEKKLEEFNKIAAEIQPIWSLPDINSCFILEAKKSHVICPTDNDEEYNMRLALSLAVDNTLIDSKIQPLRDTQLGGRYKVLYTTDSKGKFKDLTVTTRPEGVVNEKNNKLIADFSRILPINKINCAFEFRHINLPVSMHEIDPLCCTKYFTDENNYLCISPSSKCYIEIRKLVKLFRSKCLEFQNKGSATPAASSDVPSPKKFDNKDAAKTGNWKGPVVFNVIDNFKYRGELAMFKGILETDQDKITYSAKENKNLSFTVPSLEFGCNTGEPCLPTDFVKSQERYLEARYDKDWIKNTYDKFFSKNKKILEEECFVLTSKEPEYETAQMVLTCALEKGEGKNLRQAIKKAHYLKIPTIDQVSNLDEFKFIPSAYDNTKFKVYLMSYDPDAKTSKLAAVSTTLLITQFGIMYKKSKEYLIKWEQALDKTTLKELLTFNPSDIDIPPSFIKLGSDPKCCFLIEGGGKKHFLCLSELNKCMMDKSYFFKRIYKGVVNAKNQILISRNNKKKTDNINIDDPFDFGIKPKFKTFPPNYNLLSLSVDQFDNSKNGKWYGWIFHQSLTERNYRLVTKPVFMRIEKGKIYLQIDVNEKPFKKIRLFEYKQICKKPCLPSEYIKIYSSVNTFDDQMYLKKSINNVLAELVKPYGENACTILDFENPTYLYGYSDIFCAIDDAQGPKIREAIENAYYIGLLNIDIENQVKKISWENDKYFARLIIEDKIQIFNYFYLNSVGLIGVKVSESKTLKDRLPEGSEKYTLAYNKISNDNYGTQCAFWYKGLKVREKSSDIKTVVSDNNCCIRFFVLPEKKKVELCTFLINEAICIRESREIMKGLKEGCKFNLKYALPPDEGRDKKPKASDSYSDNILDDHDNGIFNGFVFASNLLNASELPPVNPYFIKVNKDVIEVFKDVKSTEAIYSINVDEIKFNCKGNNPCSATDFRNYAENQKIYLKFLPSITTQYDFYLDNYPAIKDSIGTGCFVIETSTAPFMICSYDMKHTENLKKALIQAYTLHYGCKKLVTVKDAEKNTVFTIISSVNGQQTEHSIVVNGKGVVDTKTNNVILNYKILDKDPVSNKKCGIWYHGVEIPFKVDHKECCFMYSTEKKEKYMCVKDERVCIGRSYQLMKQIWSGCMFNSPTTEGSNNEGKSNNAEIYGQENYIEKTPFDPNDFKYDVCPERRDAKIFDNENLIKTPYTIDKFNDIIYSFEKTVYKGWFDLYPIPFKKEAKFSMMHVYGELNPESFKFFKKPGDKAPLFVIRPDMLSVSCQSGSTCTPLEYGKMLKKLDPKYDAIIELFESKQNLYEMKNDQGCAILENEINGKENHYMICINVKKPRTENYVLSQTIKDFNYSARRTAISNKYGSIIRRIIYDSKLIASKFVTIESLPVSSNPATNAKVSRDDNVLEYFEVSVNDNGLSSANGLVVKFDDLDSCDVYFNLVYVKEKVMFNKKRECCFRFQYRAVFEYVCLNTFDCEYNTLAIARDFYEKCLVKKDRQRSEDIIYNELNTGKHFFALDYIKKLFNMYRLTIIDSRHVNVEPNRLSNNLLNFRNN
jgi:hypothetical protein